MKRFLICVLLFISPILADSIVVTVGVGSKHFLPYDLNENNAGIGIGYQYEHENADYVSQIDYILFKNSYGEDTQFTGYTINKTFGSYEEFKYGGFGSIVYNDGYCGFFEYCKDGMDNTGLLPLFGGFIQLDHAIIKFTALPNIEEKRIDAIVGMLQFKFMDI